MLELRLRRFESPVWRPIIMTDLRCLGTGRPGHIIAFQGHQPEDFFASPLGDHLELVVRA